MRTQIRFIDVFAGCGGLSLGLLDAGCKGVFAIERSPLAFETLRYNLVDGKRYTFDWPAWLPKTSMTCEELLEKYGPELDRMKGTIDLIVGGPPCQGFSMAGRRDPADPRNQMTEQYLKLVEKIQPRYLVLENVAGFDIEFDNAEEGLTNLAHDCSYADYVAGRLEQESGYTVYRGLVNCSDFGVPQNRVRYLMLCECNHSNGGVKGVNLLEELRESRLGFLRSKKLHAERRITVKEAIGDLAITGKPLENNADSGIRGFKEAKYSEPVTPTGYLWLMRQFSNGQAPNSRRLANHKLETVQYFKKVQTICRPGFCLSAAERSLLGRKKHSTTVLNQSSPAPTVTTLPDDILHYCEPRILTVRENARLQSFPDWFAFQGKYTTGGKMRKQECPRYTQVGNAVPPLLADAIGRMLIKRSQILTERND